MKRVVFILLIILSGSGAAALDQPAVENLPKLYDTVPQQLFQTLGPVGAGAKTILEARHQLQREALKVSADAVVAVTCEEGGIVRDGLTFAKQSPYCRGMAVKWIEETKEKP